VQIRAAVREAWTQMQQRARGLSGHARVAVRGSRHHALEKAEHTTHLRRAIERSNDMHFGSTWVGEAGVNSASDQRANKTFSAVHIGKERDTIVFDGRQNPRGATCC
jgi:hypothetical protein